MQHAELLSGVLETRQARAGRRTVGGEVVSGQARLARTSGIDRVELDPPGPASSQAAIEAIRAAAFAQLAIFALIGLAMYFLLIRPQRKRQREQVALQRAVEVGDEIMTTSGLYGFVTGFDGDIAWIEIDDNVQIRIARQAIQRKVDTSKGETAVPNGKDAPAPTTNTDIDDIASDES